MFSLKLEVSRSILIDKPLPAIHRQLLNFKTWQHWSPWLCMDKQAQLEFFGDDGEVDSGYNWHGEWIGEGQLKYTQITPGALGLRLEFLKPWHSVAKVFFKLKPVTPNSTEVTWIMRGSLPIFMFFMRKSMQAFIGMDYQRGLVMLKDYLETGVVSSVTEISGLVEVSATRYVGVRRTCAIDDIKTSMHSAYADLIANFNKNGFTQTGSAFTICHEWNPISLQFDYTVAFPVTQLKEEKISGLIQAIRPAVQALMIQHTGEYKHLANAWATGNSRLRMDKKLKQNKKQPCFEIYVNDPEYTRPVDLITEIYMPVN